MHDPRHPNEEPGQEGNQSAALSHLRDFIREFQDPRAAASHVISGLRQLEDLLTHVTDPATADQLAEETNRWLNRVARDFAHPTLEQLFAHLTAILLSFGNQTASVLEPLRLSESHRPDSLKPPLKFLAEYLPEHFFDPGILPAFHDQREAIDKIADLLVRRGVAILPDSLTPEEFEAMPVPRQVLELYKRKRKHGAEYKNRAGSLEAGLVHAGVIERVRRRHRNYHEFVGPNGLQLESGGGPGFIRRLLKRISVWFHIDPIHAENLTARFIIVALLLINIGLYGFVWRDQIGKAEREMDRLTTKAIESVLPASWAR